MQKRNLKENKSDDDELDLKIEDDKSSGEHFTSLNLERALSNNRFMPNDEFRKEAMLTDIKVFGLLFQILIGAFFILLIVLNVFNINHYCKLFLEENSFRCECVLGKCHYYLMGISLAIINIITAFLLAYDYNQAKKKGYRLNEYFLYFIAWVGGWLPVLLFLLLTNYKRTNLKITKTIALIALVSVTTPCLYLVFFF